MVVSGGGHHQIGGHTVDIAFMKTNTKNGKCSVRMFPFTAIKKVRFYSAPFHNSIISQIVLHFTAHFIKKMLFHRFLQPVC